VKKLIILFLFISSICEAQNDFRLMNWGETFDDLINKYPNQKFDPSFSKNPNVFLYSHSTQIDGIEAYVTFHFCGNILVSGSYSFKLLSNEQAFQRLKDFNVISKKLTEKYDITRGNEFYKIDGELYEVSKRGRSEFFEKFPNATKNLNKVVEKASVKKKWSSIIKTEIIHKLDTNSHTLFYISQINCSQNEQNPF